MPSRDNAPAFLLVLMLLAGGGLYARKGATPAKDGTGRTETPFDAVSGGVQTQTAFDLISQFFFRKPACPEESAADVARCAVLERDVDVDVLLATVPDPVDSHLDYLFDRTLEALRRGIRAADYRLVSWAHPWPIPRTTATERSGAPDSVHEPGVLLFHRSKAPEQLLAVLLVGESPVRGLNGAAFEKAMQQAAAMRRWRPEHLAEPLRILGPYFSGTSRTLRRALEEYARTNVGRGDSLHVRLLSGSATNPENKAILERGVVVSAPLTVEFSATVQPDDALRRALFDFLRERRVRASQVAVLTEENTAYGDSFRREALKPAKRWNEWRPLTIPFPLHISQVRAAHAKDSTLGSLPESSPSPASSALAPPLDETPSARDVIPPSSRLSPVSDEIVLNQILGTISRLRIRFVGLAATDARDKLFLGKQIALNCPGVVLFTFESEILHSQPRYSPYFRGMLVASTYPLLPRNQFWTRVDWPDQMLQFSGGGGQGVFNAAQLLLGARGLLEYEHPFPRPGWDASGAPPVWISIVGNRSIWPMAIATPDSDVTDYTQRVRTAANESSSRPVRWLLPSRLAKLVFLLIISGASFVAVLFLYGRLRGHPAPVGFAGAMFALRDGSPHLAQKRIFLFLSLGVLAVVCTVLGGLCWFPYRFEADVGRRLDPYPLAASVCAGLLLIAFLVSAREPVQRDVSLLRAFLRRGDRRRTRLVAAIRVGFPAALVFGLLFAFLLVLAIVIAIPLEPSHAFLWERAANPISGLSPIVPFLILAAGCFLNTTCHLARLTLAERLQVSSPFKGVDLASTSPLNAVEEDIGRALVSLWPTFLASILTVGLLALSLSRLLGHVFTELDGRAFARLFELTFFLLFLGVVLSALRFVAVWRRLRVFLGRLASHPLAPAFDRLPPAFRRIAGYQSFGRLRQLSELSTPAEYARLLSHHWLKAGPALAKSLEIEPWRMRELDEGMAQFGAAQESLAEHLKRAAGDPKLVSRGGSDVVPKLNEGTRSLLEVLDRAWRIRPLSELAPRDTAKRDEAKEKDRQTQDPLDWLRAAEELVAMQTTLFLNYVFVHLWNLIAFYAVGALLIFVAVVSYPYQPARLILNVLFVLITALGFLSIALFVQMDRDEILSRISKTVPGKISWDFSFLSRVFVYGVIPVLSLLAARVPEVQTSIAGWLDGLARVVK